MTRTSGREHHRVIVVGTGFAGIGMAIRLRERGITDFVVLERAGDIGGTWRDNTYPGAACDVPSHLYSFSFALNPAWSRSFSGQQEIWDYLQRCTDAYGVRPHLRLHHEVLDASWDHDARRWHVRTNRGGLTADILVTGTGALSEPSTPDIPGLESFQGSVFHSAQWDHSHDLSGRRVAVIGTGASAIQFVPEIQPEVESLTVFQRTPPWVIPRLDRDLTGAEKALYRAAPRLQQLVRAAIYWARESYVLGFSFNRRLMKAAELIARRQLRRQVPDEAVRATLTPDYTIGCKRILISSDYYPAIMKSNVDVVTSGITEIGPRSVCTGDGAEREVDTIIFGTGFHVTDMPVASRIRGREGRCLAETWADSAQAHRGTTVAGFPNLFMLVGPNTGLGHTSMVYMIESQVSYVLDALRHLERSGAAAVEARLPAQVAYNESVQERMRDTVWTTGGCASWYLDARGRNTTLWPSFSWQFRRATRRFEPAEYVEHERVPEHAAA
ncbi:MAG: NAD(P)-binding protein [Pseudonocardiaceae bacterium]|nr:NAD(P)-binding protein [Pseudonocardiaceae bacterium]